VRLRAALSSPHDRSRQGRIVGNSGFDVSRLSPECTVGLITAFSITNASQNELQFYRSVMEDPVVKLAAKVGILTSLLASRLEGIEPGEAAELTAPLGELTHR
jgi:hypothetical protein